MPKWKQGALVVTYIAAVLAAGEFSPTSVSWAVDSVLSAAFVWAYLAWAHGGGTMALAWVIFVTVVVPSVMLVVIATTAYQTWAEVSAALRDNARIISFVAPVIVAVMLVSTRRRHAI